MFKNIVAKRYFLTLNGSGKYIIGVGVSDEIDKYVAEKFGSRNISSIETLDGTPIIQSSLTDESTESNMLNRVYYEY